MTSKTLRNLFLALLFLGVFGRWILLPGIRNVKVRTSGKNQKELKISDLSCLRESSCRIEDLRGIHNLLGDNRVPSRHYLIKNKMSFIENNSTLYYYLRAFLVGDTALDKQLSIELGRLSDREFSSFLRGLFQCHHLECQNFFNENKEKLQLEKYVEIGLKLKIKSMAIPWHEKNKYLSRLLDNYHREEAHTHALDIIDYVPNHPKLKRFVEKHFDKIRPGNNSRKAAIYLSRYVKGWHDRKMSKLENLSNTHLEDFIFTLKNDCPGDLKRMVKSIESHKYYLENKAKLRRLMSNEIRYVGKDFPDIRQMYGVKKEDIVQGAMCNRVYFD